MKSKKIIKTFPRVTRFGFVQWQGHDFYHDKLAALHRETVLIQPSKKHPETKIKVFYGGKKICTIKCDLELEARSRKLQQNLRAISRKYRK